MIYNRTFLHVFFFFFFKMEKEMQLVGQFVLSLIYQPTGTEVKRLLLYPCMSELFHCHWKKYLPKLQESLFLSLLEAQVA